MTGLGTSTGPQIANERQVARDLAWTFVARGARVVPPGAAGSRFIECRGNLPRMEPKESRAQRWQWTGSNCISCVPETSAGPGLFSYVSQEISVLLKVV